MGSAAALVNVALFRVTTFPVVLIDQRYEVLEPRKYLTAVGTAGTFIHTEKLLTPEAKYWDTQSLVPSNFKRCGSDTLPSPAQPELAVL